ncbi:hypothetical protein B484DRAFT_399971 [Ochromonadaceae sp. CCMP2298]|nr:hypothetical protein B484DRAFT_399971 [Ochromonadaceae sp. CCMP2298]
MHLNLLGYNDGQAGGARAGANGNGYNENNEPNPNNFWDKMPQDKKTIFLTVVGDDTTRSANTVIAIAAATTQEPPTTKDDMCRLLALRSDPGAQVIWAAAQEGNTTRRVLGARQSTSAPNGLGGSLAEEADPYGTLSVQFNDFDTFLPQNMLLAYRNGRQVVPYRPAYVEVTYLASFCNELNRTNLARLQILRDGPWIKKTWKSLKAKLSSIFEDFLRSSTNFGNSNEDEVKWLSPHECERWIRKCNIKHRLYPDVSAYAYGVMDKADCHSLGKTQEKGTSRDNTIAGAGEGGTEEANQARRERTGKRKGAPAAKGVGDEIADALKLSSSNELQMKSHELMMQLEDAAAKLSAMAAIQYFGEHEFFANQLCTPASGSGASADSDSEDDSQRLVGGGVIGRRDNDDVSDSESVSTRQSDFGGAAMSGRERVDRGGGGDDRGEGRDDRGGGMGSGMRRGEHLSASSSSTGADRDLGFGNRGGGGIGNRDASRRR